MNKSILEKTTKVSDSVRVLLVLILAIFALNMSIPQTVQAESLIMPDLTDNELSFSNPGPYDLITQNYIAYDIQRAKAAKAKTIRSYTVVATAYSSDVAQTDSTPCITASGFNVCEHGKEDIIAANFLPIGTKVKVPDMYGDTIFTVEDRMNKRYTYRVDFWKASRNRAITFGNRLIRIEVVQ